jgi:hypothetical protein
LAKPIKKQLIRRIAAELEVSPRTATRLLLAAGVTLRAPGRRAVR